MNWSKHVDAAMAELEKDGRVYKAADLLSVLDDVVAGISLSAIMANRGFKKDLISTALSHVTTAIHGSGDVPPLAEGGWYRSHGSALPYEVAPGFRVAWLAERGE